MKLWVKKYPQEGDLRHTYSALKNKVKEDNSLVDFNTKELSLNLNNPLNMECQPSYDGTVNIILNDDVNPPRLINSRFTKIEDNRYRIITRNQKEQTNLYTEGEIDLQTRLFRNLTKIPKLQFVELNYFGKLKGGNYTFYIKYADDDYNKTDVVCESGQISIFKGNLFDVTSVSGTLQDEITDKSIKLQLSNIDQSFSKFYIYYTREFSDTNGFRMTETRFLTKPYEISGSTKEIIINGYESEEQVSDTELNIQYNYINTVKTQAQVQNRLFFGNITNTNCDIVNLQNLSLFFEIDLKQKESSIGWIDPDTYMSNKKDILALEYYDPKNIYYNLGYWPEEIYRLGVVYIMSDDSLSPVFNLRGCNFTKDSKTNKRDVQYRTYNKETHKWEINYIERDSFLSGNGFIELDNSYGVFKNPSEKDFEPIQNYNLKETKPWFYQISIPDFSNVETDFSEELRKLGVKGFFFVRQKRIPITLCQGYSIGVDKSSSIPVLTKDGKEYFTESFLATNRLLTDTFGARTITSETKLGNGLISVDACADPMLQTYLDGSKFVLQRTHKNGILKQNGRKFTPSFEGDIDNSYVSQQCVFVNSDVPYKYVNGFGFRTRAGSAETVREFAFFGKDVSDYNPDSTDERNSNLKVRGIYAPFIGVCGNIDDNAIYNVKIQNYSSNYNKDYFSIRANDNTPFYAISDRFGIDENITSFDIYRGDCFTNTVTVRLNRNFIDPDYPINDTIIDSETWKNHYNGFYNTKIDDKDNESEDKPDGNWAKINRGDLNAVPLGMWISYKCLSNRNLGLRAEDRSYPDETALMGNPRSFYPLQDASTKSANKIPESFILNDGYSATVGQKTHISAPNVPYIKDQFDNRIMFSNIQVDGDFKNGYRVFQGLSYEDIDRQYGAIVKLIPWGVNLFCVFEHGLGVVPINEKALMQTTTEQSIHLYGAGVLQKQISLITPDYGSIWPESVIRTPIGIYGVDTYAKKIWRYTDSNGFETISDMKIQRFLNDNIKLNESDKYPIIALKNVKSHYNNYKGDVMFTFYNFVEGKEWNFCYNERMNKWITRYSWTPLYSENINNIFYSLDKKRAEILAHIYDNRNCSYGINTTENEWRLNEKGDLTDVFETEINLVGIDLATGFDITINSIKTSYIKDGIESEIIFDPDFIKEYVKIEDTENPLTKRLSWERFRMETILEYSELDYKVPLYYKIDVTVIPKISGFNAANIIRKTIGVVVDYKYAPTEYDDLLCNGFYVHGRAGIFNEIDYEDDNENNQIKPTYWYNKQEPFEFEFVVNEPVGLHKIFDNLVIISNKAKPNSIEIEVIGDMYNFKKSGLLKDTKFKNTTINYDPILNQKTLITEQECKDMEKVGRRMGNIHYKEDSWYLTVEPIKFKNNNDSAWSSTRIRDKFAKVRVKYSGEDTVIITAIKTLLNLTTS